MTDRLTSIHEAGHSTLGYLLGEMPEVVSIKTEGYSLGHVQYLGVEADAIARAAVLGRRNVDRDRVMSNLISTAAGPVAQALHMGGARSIPFPWTTYGGMADHSQATKLMTAAGDLLRTRYLDDVVEEARDLLQVPRIWEAVERVSRELMRYKELDFKHLELVVLGAIDGTGGVPPRLKPGRASRIGTVARGGRTTAEQRSTLTADLQLAAVKKQRCGQGRARQVPR